MTSVLSRAPRKCILRFISSQVTTQQKNLNTRPIIGMVGVDTDLDHGKTYIPVNYVNFVLQGGARVVPIRGSQPKDYYEEIVGMTNGAFFPGGSADMGNSIFTQTASDVLDAAVKINQSGEYYPVWGTCLGLQLMCWYVDHDALDYTDSYGICLPLTFTSEATRSRMFGNAPQEVIDILKTKPMTQNQHRYGVLTKKLSENLKLASFFNVLTTNKDLNGMEFASSIEAKEYPFYAVQWHPEKNNFNWNTNFHIDHGPDAVKVVQYFGNFFVEEARRCSNSYPDMMKEAKSLIQNCKRIYYNDGSFFDWYFVE